MAQNFNLGELGQFVTVNVVSNSNTVTFTSNVIIQAGLSANGSYGGAGQVLLSNGATGSPYWGAVSINLASSYAFTNTTASVNATSGAITTTGGIGVANNLYVGGRVGFANTAGSVGYFQYNSTTGSIDMVFG